MKKKPTTKSPDRRREQRSRGMPRWLSGREDLDQVAQRRTMMILSVLSGHTPVTTAISEHGISRPLYYQLETKGLIGMMKALIPGANASASPDEATPMRQVADLEDKITRLEQEKRRLERLLLLAKKLVPAGPIAMPERRGRKPGRRSTSGGPGPSRSSTKSTTSASPPSIPTTDGGPTP